MEKNKLIQLMVLLTQAHKQKEEDESFPHLPLHNLKFNLVILVALI